MGASTSSLTPDEVSEITRDSHFNEDDVQRLYTRFRALDRSKSGYVSVNELQLIPELSMNPLGPRVIALFDENGSDRVNFKRFVQTLSVFRPDATKEEKLRLAFKCYDVDGDGVVSHTDLFLILKMLVGSNLSDDQLQLIVKKTVSDASKDGDAIDFKTFCKVLGEKAADQLTLDAFQDESQ